MYAYLLLIKDTKPILKPILKLEITDGVPKTHEVSKRVRY